MPIEPRDPALVALFRATVRLQTKSGSGSGVVIRGPSGPLVATAAHIFNRDEQPIIRKSGLLAEGSVVGRDPERDVALLMAPSELGQVALELADDEDPARPGDAIWGAGFPAGLEGTDPALVPGVVATVGEKNWANLDGTWGNSGGPICAIRETGPKVVGILLGRAGDVNRTLQSFRSMVEFATQKIVEFGPLFEQVATASGTDPALPRVLMSGQRLSLDTSRRVLELLEEHFRTGFLRFAPVVDLRRLLRASDGGPSR
jgi:hypothetical protein